jgi:hypothetical protein
MKIVQDRVQWSAFLWAVLKFLFMLALSEFNNNNNAAQISQFKKP